MLFLYIIIIRFLNCQFHKWYFNNTELCLCKIWKHFSHCKSWSSARLVDACSYFISKEFPSAFERGRINDFRRDLFWKRCIRSKKGISAEGGPAWYTESCLPTTPGVTCCKLCNLAVTEGTGRKRHVLWCFVSGVDGTGIPISGPGSKKRKWTFVDSQCYINCLTWISDKEECIVHLPESPLLGIFSEILGFGYRHGLWVVFNVSQHVCSCAWQFYE